MIKARNFLQAAVVVLILEACVNAAPSELLTKLENSAKVESDVKLDEPPNTLAEEVKSDTNDTATQVQRQKRQFYNYHGYGFPPINPVIYPNYNRDDFPIPGYQDDPLAQIYRRLQDIAIVVRQPNHPPPPPPNQFPFYFPVIYIPQVGCACNLDQYVPPNQRPTSPRPSRPGDKNDTSSNVDISNRFPEMDDERQNWGLVVNNPVVDDGQEEDFTRPISFDPIQPNRTMNRPPPPVDHGSNQAGVNEGATSTNTINQGPTTTTTVQPVARPIRPTSPVEPPTACDGAVLSCCHQPEVTYDCFAIQGCPDPSFYGNPCDTQVILRVVEKFQRFYGQRTG